MKELTRHETDAIEYRGFCYGYYLIDRDQFFALRKGLKKSVPKSGRCIKYIGEIYKILDFGNEIHLFLEFKRD